MNSEKKIYKLNCGCEFEYFSFNINNSNNESLLNNKELFSMFYDHVSKTIFCNKHKKLVKQMYLEQESNNK